VKVKGGSAFIPGLKTGDFPLRPLHPRKLKTEDTSFLDNIRWGIVVIG